MTRSKQTAKKNGPPLEYFPPISITKPTPLTKANIPQTTNPPGEPAFTPSLQCFIDCLVATLPALDGLDSWVRWLNIRLIGLGLDSGPTVVLLISPKLVPVNYFLEETGQAESYPLVGWFRLVACLLGWFGLASCLHPDGDMRALEDSPDGRNPPAGGHGTVVAAFRPSSPPRPSPGAAVGSRAGSDERYVAGQDSYTRETDAVQGKGDRAAAGLSQSSTS